MFFLLGMALVFLFFEELVESVEGSFGSRSVLNEVLQEVLKTLFFF